MPSATRCGVPNRLPSTGMRDALSGFSNSSAGPPACSTRSQISVISRRGSTSTPMRFSSPTLFELGDEVAQIVRISCAKRCISGALEASYQPASTRRRARRGRVLRRWERAENDAKARNLSGMATVGVARIPQPRFEWRYYRCPSLDLRSGQRLCWSDWRASLQRGAESPGRFPFAQCDNDAYRRCWECLPSCRRRAAFAALAGTGARRRPARVPCVASPKSAVDRDPAQAAQSRRPCGGDGVRLQHLHQYHRADLGQRPGLVARTSIRACSSNSPTIPAPTSACSTPIIPISTSWVSAAASRRIRRSPSPSRPTRART